MKTAVSITSISSLSALGKNQSEIWKKYQNRHHYMVSKSFDSFTAWVAAISDENKEELHALRLSNSAYKNLDHTVLYAIYTSREAVKKAGWKASDCFGVNIGSSRGATALFEKYHRSFLKYDFAEIQTSPTTTLGNISSWVAHDLQTDGPEISHSITCSTALHALLNGVAWIQGGMADKFLVGGSEAALTAFTIAQMQALKIYTKESTLLNGQHQNNIYPSRAFDLNKKENTMVIGEGAAILCLEKGKPKNSMAAIEGVGFATEILEHSVSISTGAQCFQKSMSMALENSNPDEVDVIIMHAPGTVKGDISEYQAIKKVFSDKLPFLTTNKWKLGHTFGASGMLSLELALLMLQHQQVVLVPYAKKQHQPESIRKILVNGVGFGGNAVSVLLGK